MCVDASITRCAAFEGGLVGAGGLDTEDRGGRRECEGVVAVKRDCQGSMACSQPHLHMTGEKVGTVTTGVVTADEMTMSAIPDVIWTVEMGTGTKMGGWHYGCGRCLRVLRGGSRSCVDVYVAEEIK